MVKKSYPTPPVISMQSLFPVKKRSTVEKDGQGDYEKSRA
jgi:hypothetical protein